MSIKAQRNASSYCSACDRDIKAATVIQFERVSKLVVSERRRTSTSTTYVTLCDDCLHELVSEVHYGLPPDTSEARAESESSEYFGNKDREEGL